MPRNLAFIKLHPSHLLFHRPQKNFSLFLAHLAFLLRFLPYVGPPMAAAGPIVLSLAVFDGWHRPLATVALFFVVELATYMIVEPLLYGQTIGVSSAALLVDIEYRQISG